MGGSWMGKVRKLGNNSLWSVDKADELLWESGELLKVAMGHADVAAAQGKTLFDILIVSEVADIRVTLAEAGKLASLARGRLTDAREGRFVGDRENVR